MNIDCLCLVQLFSSNRVCVNTLNSPSLQKLMFSMNFLFSLLSSFAPRTCFSNAFRKDFTLGFGASGSFGFGIEGGRGQGAIASRTPLWKIGCFIGWGMFGTSGFLGGFPGRFDSLLTMLHLFSSNSLLRSGKSSDFSF